MRELTPSVSFINRLEGVTESHRAIRPEDDYSHTSQQEKDLARALQIREGTVFIIEHETTYGVQSLLEELKQAGVIRRYGEGPQFSDYPKINFGTVSFYADDAHTENLRARGYSALGSRIDEALYKALFETLERHATFYVPSPSVTRLYPTLTIGDASFLYPLMPTYSETQTKYFPFLVSKKEDLSHTLGLTAKSLVSGKRQFLPVHCFYFGKSLISPETPVSFEPTSNGSACGQSLEEAQLRALYELIERDHFLLYWLSGAAPQEIELDPHTEFDAFIQNVRTRYNLEIHFFDLHYDMEVPMCMALIIDPVLNLLAIGAKIGMDPDAVLKGSYLEALAVLDSIRSGGRASPEETFTRIQHEDSALDTAIDTHERVALYCSPKGISYIRALWLSSHHVTIPYSTFARAKKTFTTPAQELTFMLNQFKTLSAQKGPGYDVYAHEHVTSYTKKYDCRVAHIFVPALMKLYLNEIFRTPISTRLQEFKATHTVSPSADATMPHPFP